MKLLILTIAKDPSMNMSDNGWGPPDQANGTDFWGNGAEMSKTNWNHDDNGQAAQGRDDFTAGTGVTGNRGCFNCGEEG
jgi:hypothetical protein